MARMRMDYNLKKKLANVFKLFRCFMQNSWKNSLEIFLLVLCEHVCLMRKCTYSQFWNSCNKTPNRFPYINLIELGFRVVMKNEIHFIYVYFLMENIHKDFRDGKF